MREKKFAGIVLASGSSERFVAANKLLMTVGGDPIVRRVVSAYCDSGLTPVVVVVGHDAAHVRDALGNLDITAVVNPDFAQGQSRALVRGIESLPASVDAAVIGVGDQPFLTPAIIQALMTAYRSTFAPIVAPRYGGQRGNPVLFDRSLFGELLAVEGDQGGRPVIERHRAEILWVDVADRRAGMDVDTPDDLRGLQPT